MEITRCSTHDDSLYMADANMLDEELGGWLFEAGPSKSSDVRGVIAPHASHSYSGHATAFVFCNLEPTRISRVFLLGPLHRLKTSKCTLPIAAVYQTPLGDLEVDLEGMPQLMAAVKFIPHLLNQQVAHELVALELLTILLEQPTDDSVEVAADFVKECGSILQDLCPKVIEELKSTGEFEMMDIKADEAEHSLEVHLPFLAKIFQGHSLKIVPILIGNVTTESVAMYGQLLAHYLESASNFFSVSSDVGRRGSRFYDKKHGATLKSVEAFIHKDIEVIETADLHDIEYHFLNCDKTICGCHAVNIFLHMMLNSVVIKVRFLRYKQSCRSIRLCNGNIEDQFLCNLCKALYPDVQTLEGHKNNHSNADFCDVHRCWEMVLNSSKKKHIHKKNYYLFENKWYRKQKA